MEWEREIIELHDFFQAYFLAKIDSIDRFVATLEPDFTMIGPDGHLSDRSQVVEAVRAGHGHTDSLEILTSDHTLLAARAGLIVARYVETHHLAARSNRRITTVVFAERTDRPNGVGWLHAHETWLDRGVD